MVAMMAYAVVVMCAAEDHNVMRRISRAAFLYPTLSPDVNELPNIFEKLSAPSGAARELCEGISNASQRCDL